MANEYCGTHWDGGSPTSERHGPRFNPRTRMNFPSAMKLPFWETCFFCSFMLLSDGWQFLTFVSLSQCNTKLCSTLLFLAVKWDALHFGHACGQCKTFSGHPSIACYVWNGVYVPSYTDCEDNEFATLQPLNVHLVQAWTALLSWHCITSTHVWQVQQLRTYGRADVHLLHLQIHHAQV